MRTLMTMKVKRRAGRRRSGSVVLALVAMMALVGAGCTPPPPPADADVVLLASQQPGGIANYQNLTVVNEPPSDRFASGFLVQVSPGHVFAAVSRPFWAMDGWEINCSGPPTDNGDGSFSCPADLVYGRLDGISIHEYAGQGLLSTWPDADPKFAAYVGTTSYTGSLGPFGNTVDPTRVGQEWTEQLRFQDGDDTVTWPPGP